MIIAWRCSACTLLTCGEPCPGRLVWADLDNGGHHWCVISGHLQEDGSLSWSHLCDVSIGLVEQISDLVIVAVDSNIDRVVEDRVNRDGGCCGKPGRRPQGFENLMGSLSEVNLVLWHVDPGSGNVACLQRFLVSFHPADIWVLGPSVSVYCLPASSPPLSDHAPFTLSFGLDPSSSELGLPQWLALHPKWKECQQFWLAHIPSPGPCFAAKWAHLEEAIHLAARDVRADRGLVAEDNVHLNFVLVSQALRAALSCRWSKVRSLLKRVLHWGVPADCQGSRLLSFLRPMFCLLHEAKLLADAESHAHAEDAWSVHRVDLLMFFGSGGGPNLCSGPRFRLVGVIWIAWCPLSLSRVFCVKCGLSGFRSPLPPPALRFTPCLLASPPPRSLIRLPPWRSLRKSSLLLRSPPLVLIACRILCCFVSRGLLGRS